MTITAHRTTWVHEFRRALLARGISEGRIVHKSEIIKVLVMDLGYSYAYAQQNKLKELVFLGVLRDLGRGYYEVV